MILKEIEHFRNKIAISSNLKELTYNELKINVKKLIKLIRKEKIQSKDLIAVEIHDSYFYIISALACIEGGYSFLPINPYMTNLEKNKIIKFSNPRFIINIVKKKFIIKKIINNKKKFHKQVCIFFTSGTTAFPKGVCHLPTNLIKNAKEFNKLTKIKKNKNFLHLFPMYYMAGFLNSIISPLLAGSKIVIFDKTLLTNYLNFWTEVIEKKINYFWASPSIIKMVSELDIEPNNFKKIKKNLDFIFVGTAPFHMTLKKNFKKRFNIDCYESYGSSEMLLVSTNYIKNTYGSGKLLNGIEIKKDSLRNLLISSPFKFYGYLKKNNEIEINDEEYFNSGDTFLSKKNFIKIVSRTKDIIIKEGINISPKYLENEILKIKYVDEVSVIGIKNNLYGEVPVAFIKSKKKLPYSFIIQNLKRKISDKILPYDIISIKEIPKNNIGKVDKKKLLKKYDNRS
ncbi:acyl--CoA ligase [Candidatus Pelagibacter sp.]|nr:acyl--CoA ligase [Candidatus Pelagibacter sp.]